VLDFDAEANALALSPFSDAEKVGSASVKIDGEIGRKFGIDWVADDAVVTHTAGTIAGDPSVTGVNAIGATSIDLTCDADDTVNLLVGDIITFAGDTQTYAVITATGAIGNSSTGPVVISPALKVATTGGEALSVKATHVVNLAFHRDAFAFANRPLAQSAADLQLGSRMLTMTDPQTGISLRLEVRRQYKQVVWEFDILWGAKLVRPELAVRIAG